MSNTQTRNTLPIGWYVVGGIAAVASADTIAGPLVIAFLAAAVVYNASALLGKAPALPSTSSNVTPGGAPLVGSGGGGHDLAV